MKATLPFSAAVFAAVLAARADVNESELFGPNVYIFSPKDPIEIYTDNDMIILKKYEPTCVFCQNSDDVTYYKGKMICRDCIKALSDIV